MAKRKKIILEDMVEETTNQKLEASGFGDFLANITSAIGIEPCEKCEQRKKALNKSFPWLKASREITDEEVDFIKYVSSTNTLQSDDVNTLFRLYNDVFSSKLIRCACPGLVSKMIQRLGVLVID
jgi:hypothetical protein